MKKNSKKMKVIILALIVAIGSYFISVTYAKYVSGIAGTDTAKVAKWKWIINSDVIDSVEDATAGYTFNLFDTIKDSDLSSTETDVDTGLIAPGTSGSFDIDITNDSEVNATYVIAFTEINASNVPIEYSFDGTTWVSNVSNLDVSATNIAMKGGNAVTTLYWRWAFTGVGSTNYTSTQTDVTDTALGFSANTSTTSVQVTATVTVTQAD